MNSKYRNAPPKAGAMIEALRGLGYSVSTSIADIVDNSIAAGATCVWIDFHWGGNKSYVSILDNGNGMTPVELDMAMRLGERNPLDDRHPDDLGRFGLGLKTASFSQCRSLTVWSKSNKTPIECLRWDLDVLESNVDDGWRLLEGPGEDSSGMEENLVKLPSGTLVVWQKLDRVIHSGFNEQNFLDLIDKVEKHLALVFHRFLQDSSRKFIIYINGRAIKGIDPFLSAHAATWSSPLENISCGGVKIFAQGYVLPHRDKLDTAQMESAGGEDGWTSQQGFYVYRNRRLLVAGSWLGLGRGRPWTKEEAYRLARIKLDIPNSADSTWKIDVKKSTARPPAVVREILTRLAEDTRERARRVFAYRGKPVVLGTNNAVLQAWIAEHTSNGVRYRIDRTHPAISEVFDSSSCDESLLNSMLRIIEETIPIQRIWLDTTESKETPRNGFSTSDNEEITNVLVPMYRNLVLKRGYSTDAAKDRLVRTEPFNSYPHLVAALPDNISVSE